MFKGVKELVKKMVKYDIQLLFKNLQLY